MLIYCNEYIMKLKVSWKLNLPAPWASVVLTSLCHILRTTSFFYKLFPAQFPPVLIPALVRAYSFLDLSSNAKGCHPFLWEEERFLPPQTGLFSTSPVKSLQVLSMLWLEILCCSPSVGPGRPGRQFNHVWMCVWGRSGG